MVEFLKRALGLPDRNQPLVLGLAILKGKHPASVTLTFRAADVQADEESGVQGCQLPRPGADFSGGLSPFRKGVIVRRGKLPAGLIDEYGWFTISPRWPVLNDLAACLDDCVEKIPVDQHGGWICNVQTLPGRRPDGHQRLSITVSYTTRLKTCRYLLRSDEGKGSSTTPPSLQRRNVVKGEPAPTRRKR